jgi:hypothetical protein
MQIRILSLHCLLNDETDKDEVFLKHLGKRVWPSGRYHKIGSGEREPVNVVVEHDPVQDLVIELWDYDLLSANDLMGTFKAKLNARDYGKHTTTLQKADISSTASYILEWEVME